MTALTRTVSGEKQIYSGNLEILRGIGKPGNFFGKFEIFSGHWAKIWYYMLSNNIYTVICTQCMRCILCILTLENGWTPHDMKRPFSNDSNWNSMKFECDWPRAIPSGLRQELYRCKAHTISSHYQFTLSVRAASAPIIVCTIVINFYFLYIMGWNKVLLLLLLLLLVEGYFYAAR